MVLKGNSRLEKLCAILTYSMWVLFWKPINFKVIVQGLTSLILMNAFVS